MNTKPPSIVPVVEGPGDRSAVPVLLRRVLQHFNRYDIQVREPKTAKGKQNLLKNYERFVEYASIEPGCVGILVLLDADDQCPVEEVHKLIERTRALDLQQSVKIVYANREYETWILASMDSEQGGEIRVRLGIEGSESYQGDVDRIHAKSWLKRKMPRGRSYKETSDQRSLTAFIDIEHTRRRSRSFRRFCHAVEELVGGIESVKATVTPVAPEGNTIGGTNHD